MSIWKQDVNLGLNSGRLPLPRAGTLSDRIGLEIIEIGADFVRGTLPVDGRTRQAFGRLHGGASCVLAEELGSIGANLCLDPKEAFAVGIEINANHLRGMTSGLVTGTARPLHIGRATQVWETRIEDEQGRLVCISRLTVSVVPVAGRPEGVR